MKSSPIPIVFRQLSRATPTTPRFTSIAPRSFPRPASSSTTPQSRLTTDPQRPPTHASKYFKTPKPAPSPTSTQDPAAKASAPPDETPAQKVARLRAARNAQKAAQFSLWDRTVVRGREIVDRIHRWFVKGIIGATGKFWLICSVSLFPRSRSRIHFSLRNMMRGDMLRISPGQ